jgi:hypothetical protein
VLGFRRGSLFAVAVLYGAESDWVRNLVAAGGGVVVRGGRRYALEDVRLVEAGDPALATFPEAVRLLGRVSGVLLIGRLGPPA